MQKPSQLFEQMQTIAVDMQNKIGEVIRNSPAKDIEKNVRAMMNQGFQRMDLVTREEFDIQSKVLAKTREKLEALEAKVTISFLHAYFGIHCRRKAGNEQTNLSLSWIILSNSHSLLLQHLILF